MTKEGAQKKEDSVKAAEAPKIKVKNPQAVIDSAKAAREKAEAPAAEATEAPKEKTMVKMQTHPVPPLPTTTASWA